MHGGDSNLRLHALESGIHIEGGFQTKLKVAYVVINFDFARRSCNLEFVKFEGSLDSLTVDRSFVWRKFAKFFSVFIRHILHSVGEYVFMLDVYKTYQVIFVLYRLHSLIKTGTKDNPNPISYLNLE